MKINQKLEREIKGQVREFKDYLYTLALIGKQNNDFTYKVVAVLTQFERLVSIGSKYYRYIAECLENYKTVTACRSSDTVKIAKLNDILDTLNQIEKNIINY